MRFLHTADWHLDYNGNITDYNIAAAAAIETSKIDGYSDTTECVNETSPGTTDGTSDATTLAGELERLRYKIKELGLGSSVKRLDGTPAVDLVSWIDTWVGPGHANGDGWAISFDFVFYPGDERGADEVVNIWGRRNITLGYIDPERNVDSLIEPVEVAIPADATGVAARLTTTGHSFGNSDNCAEFCILRQDLYVDGERRSVVPWRTDCEHNPVRGQQGTWTYDRNGWCPGAIVIGDTIDITDLATPGETATIDYIRTFEGEEYENTRPGDLEPLEWISLQLYVWRR